MLFKAIKLQIVCLILFSINMQAAEKDYFTFILLPDTENYSAHWPQIAYSQTEWIAANAESLNIQFVFHLGDITDNCQTREWEVMHTAIYSMDGHTPYSLCVGNHDYDFPPVIDERSTLLFNQYFPHTDAPSTLAGFYKTGVMDNCYHLFKIGYTRYLNLVLEFGPRDAVLEWANEIIAQYPQHKVIISTHCYMNWDDTRVDEQDRYNPHNYAENVNHGEEMWEKLVKKHENIFMVVSGHMLTAGGLGNLVSENNFGKNVYQMLVDYQGYDNGGNGYLRILKFYPDEKRIEATSYSPWLDQYFTDSKNQFVYENAVEAFADLVPPEFIPNPMVTALEDEPIELDKTLLYTHVDDPNHEDEDLFISLYSGSHIQIEQSPTGFTGLAPQDWFGTDSLLYIASDPTGLADTTFLQIRVLPVNDKPLITDLHHFRMREDESYKTDFGFYLEDPDNELNELDFTLTVTEFILNPTDYPKGSPNATVDDLHYTYDKQTQELEITTFPDIYGKFAAEFKISDPEGLFDAHNIFIYVYPINDRPTISTLPIQSFAEDDSLVINPQDWLAFVTDDSPLEQMQWTSSHSQNIFSRQVDKNIIFTSTKNWFGQDSLRMIVTDIDGLSDTAFVTFNITPVNDAPYLDPIPDIAFNEDEKLHVDLLPLMHDIDDSLALLNITATAIDYAPSEIKIAGIQDLLISVNGHILQFESSGDSSGTYQVMCTLCDPQQACDSDTFQVSIIPQNDPPAISKLPALYWQEDDSLELNKDYFTSFVHDPDHPHGELKIHFKSSSILIDSTETGWTFETPRDWFGNDSFLVYISDPLQAMDSTIQHIHITPVNDPPVWQALENISLQEEKPMILLLGDLINDVDHPTKDLRISAESSDSSLVEIQLDPSLLKLTLTAKTETADTLTLTLWATDPEGLAAKASCELYVSPVNDAPILTTLPPIKMQEDTETSIPVSAWFGYVSDPDHSVNNLQWKIKESDHILIQFKDDVVNFLPQRNWFGSDSVLVKVIDPLAAADSIWLKIHVAAVNDAPSITGLPDSLSVGSDAENIYLWDYIEDIETPDAELDIHIGNASATLFSYYEKSTGELILLSTSAEAFESWLKIYVTDTDHATSKDSMWVYYRPTGVQGAAVIQELTLQPCYPNPFNGKTSIQYALPIDSDIQLYVLNILGKHIIDLETGFKNAGEHAFIWESNGLPSGAYFIILQTAQERLVQRCLLVN